MRRYPARKDFDRCQLHDFPKIQHAPRGASIIDMSFAFVFPGQGSQCVGMLQEFAQHCPQIEACFGEASEVLGYDLWQLVQNGPEDKLSQTQVTQPVMLTAGVAVWRAWRARSGPLPSIMAGHSLGEYSALVCAEALEFSEAVSLVADRSRYMQEAVPAGTGAMAAILGLDAESVRRICAEAAQGEVLEPANFNSPIQVVIGGTAAAVERASGIAKQAGAKRVLRLPMSAPSHCSLMRPAAARMIERLKKTLISSPKIPVLHNTHVQTESDPQTICEVLVRQIETPVQWVATIEKMAASGIAHIIECGPGKILTGLNKRIATTVEHLSMSDSAGLRAALTAVAA